MSREQDRAGAQIEQVEARLAAASTDRERVDALNALAEALADSDISRAISLGEQACQLAQGDTSAGQSYQKGLADGQAHLARLHYEQARYDRGLSYALDAMALYDAIADLPGKQRVLRTAGAIYRQLGDFATALECYLDSLHLCQELQDKMGEAGALNGIATIHSMSGDRQKGVRYLHQSLQIYQQLGARREQAMILNNCCVDYRYLGQYEASLAKGMQSLQIAQELGVKSLEGLALSNIGRTYTFGAKFDEALECLYRALPLAKAIGDRHGVVFALLNIGQAYNGKGQADRALSYLTEALTVAQEIEAKREIYLCHQELATSYKQLGDFANALAHYEQFHRVKEAVFDRQADNRIKSLEVRYRLEAAQKETEIYQLRNVELEQRVRERTAELTAANATLQAEIAERERVESVLRASEARNRALLEAIPDAIFEMDREGIYVHFIPGRDVDLLVPPAQFLGKKIQDVLPADVAQQVLRHFRVVMQSGGLQVFEYSMPIQGRTAYYEARLVRIGQERVLGIVRDMTERKLAEQEIQTLNRTLESRIVERTAQLESANRELARSNQELGRFAYVVSHDLQEPLRMIKSYLQLLEQRYKGQLDADADDFIAFAVGGAARMEQLIQDLLAYSRVRTKGKPMATTDCNVVLERVLDNLQLVIQESKAVVVADRLPVVMADEMQLMQLLQNLIGNALKFCKPDEPPRIHVGAKRVNGQFEFAVQDNGIGIDPRYFERIFGIFQRLHSRDAYPGTGIGLAICRRIVERHGGKIWVTSELGQGATFYFTLGAV